MKLKNSLIEMAKPGQLDRRSFMRRAIALGLTASSASLLLSQSVLASPKKGGRFRIGVSGGGTTDSLDPATTESQMTILMNFTYGNNLTEVNNDGRLIPELAESFDSADGKTWTFKLRSGVQFHNGKSLTADDVIASFNYHRGEATKSAVKALLTAVKGIRKQGTQTVVFELDAANADFPYIVSDYHLIILPAAADGNIDPLSGISTGPYVLQEFNAGSRAFFKRNPNYWKSGRAHFDEVEVLAIPDTTARQNAMINGEVDAIDRVDPKTAHLLERVPSVKTIEVTGTLHYTFPMRVNAPPFDNNDLRMALKLAVDREQMVNKILLGHGALGNDHPISTANRFHASNLPQRSYDPDKAKYHLKKAGMEGAKIQLSTSDAAFPGAVDAALLYKDSAANAGIDIEVVREPSDGYWSNVWNKKPWSACYWGGRPTEDWMFSSAYVRDTEWNDTAWVSGPGVDRFNEIVVAARAELDNARRAQMYAEAQQLISDYGGAVIPMFANILGAIGKNVMHDEKIAANWENDGDKCAERWWFA